MRTVVIALILTVAAASSRGETRFGWGVHGGLSFASFAEPSNQFYGLGFGGGANADFDIIDYLTARLNFDYTMFPSDKAKLKSQFVVTDPNGNPTDFTVEGANLSAFGISLNAVGKIPTGSAVTPYGLFGVGLNIGTGSDFSIISGGQTLFTQSIESKTDFGLNFGAGSEFRVGSSRLYVEARHVLIFADGSTVGYTPVSFGVMF